MSKITNEENIHLFFSNLPKHYHYLIHQLITISTQESYRDDTRQYASVLRKDIASLLDDMQEMSQSILEQLEEEATEMMQLLEDFVQQQSLGSSLRAHQAISRFKDKFKKIREQTQPKTTTSILPRRFDIPKPNRYGKYIVRFS